MRPLLFFLVAVAGFLISFFALSAVTELVWNSWIVGSFHATALGFWDAFDLTLLLITILMIIYQSRL